MFTPINTTYYQPIYVHQDSRSEAQKCLEQSEYADLLAKSLRNEQFTEADAARISACVRERESIRNIVSAAFIVIMIASIVGIFVWTKV